jgi:thiamine kinase-like enzyme
VDWEYAGNGNPFFDLGNLAVNLELDAAQCQHLLEMYFGNSNPELRAQLHLMQLASDLREAFWGFLQAGISSLEFDFMGYGEKHLKRFRQNVGSEEFELWLTVLRT